MDVSKAERSLACRTRSIEPTVSNPRSCINPIISGRQFPTARLSRRHLRLPIYSVIISVPLSHSLDLSQTLVVSTLYVLFQNLPPMSSQLPAQRLVLFCACTSLITNPRTVKPCLDSFILITLPSLSRLYTS